VIESLGTGGLTSVVPVLSVTSCSVVAVVVFWWTVRISEEQALLELVLMSLPWKKARQ
jgi:hypothetical protein